MSANGVKLGSEPDDFADMLRIAARDARISGVNYSLKRARIGSYSLLAAAGLLLCLGIFGWINDVFPIRTNVNPRITSDIRMGVVIAYLLAGAIFIGLFFWAQRNPLAPSVIGLGLYTLFALVSALLVADACWLFEFLLLLAILDFMRAALQYHRSRRKLLLSQLGENKG